MNYNFEWDPKKAVQNESKHRIKFEQAASIFCDPRSLTIYDDSHSLDEERWITLGISNRGNVITVVHTYVEVNKNLCKIRIISARKATKKEKQQYMSDDV